MKPERQNTMHQQDAKNHQNMSQTSPLRKFLKKFTQIAVSFSLFSFIFLHYPSWFSYSIHSFISQLSKNPSQLLSFVTDKNYIFLLCNGILVFVAKYSNRTVKNQPSTQQDQMIMNSDYNDLMLSSYPQTPQPSSEKLIMEDKYVIAEEEQEEDMRLEEKEVMAEEEQEEQKTAQFLNTYGREKEEEDDGVFGDAEDDDSKECVKEVHENKPYIEEKEEEIVVEEEVEEEEVEEGISQMSTEELNRKFEEFIRKMKEELRIEAQQQVIMV